MPPYSGPKLPSVLLGQVGGGAQPRSSSRGGARGGRGGRGGRNNAPTTRKDQRKEERQQKKQPRNLAPRGRPQHGPPSGRPAQGLRVVNPADEDDDLDSDDFDDDDEEEEVKRPPPQTARSTPKSAAVTSSKPTSVLPTKATPIKDVKHVEKAAPKINKRMQEKFAQDDAEISALEKKLGLKKGKKLGKSFEEEGLADLLGDLDEDEVVSVGKRKRSEDKEWLEKKRRRVAPGIEEEEGGDESESESEEGEEIGGEEQDDASSDENINGIALDDIESDSEEGDLMLFDDGDIAEVDMDGEPPEESSDLDDDGDEEDLDTSGGEEGAEDDEAAEEDFSGFESEGAEETQDESEVLARPVRENPYIAPGTTTDKSAGKYVPPSLRAPPSSDAELTGRLKRQVQGLLNRLSEANIISILGDVEKLYQSNPRQYVTSSLIDLLLGLLTDPTTLNETFIILHAGFISAIYKVIGADFGAQLIERLVEGFDRHYKQAESDESNGKQSTNLMSLVAQLYNLQVIGPELVFDYIRNFLNGLTELHTELLLRLVRSSGYQLRQDDPSSLKDIVLLVQRTASQTGADNLSVRTKFMIETINDLKNNKPKAGATASAINSEHLTRMRKTLGTLNNRNLKTSEPMRIGLHDLRDTEKRGKWWLVGASWRGRDNDNQTSKTNASAKATEVLPGDINDEDDGESDLLVLARNARMNTDIRRAIFVTIMSANDYKDAHIKLVKLNLKRAQEVEIPRVLLHCVGAEKQYNPYYTLIARKLCGEHKQRMAFQFALWDFFKRLGERANDDDEAESEEEDEEGERGVNMAVLVNYAKMFGNLVATGGLGLNVLKNLDLVYLQPKTRTFLEILLVTVLIASSSSGSGMKRSSVTTTLHLRKILEPAFAFENIIAGLQYFFKKVVVKTDLTKDQKEKAVVRKGCREAIRLLESAAAGEHAEEEDEE